MTPEAVNAFKRFLRLRDLDSDEPEPLFRAMASVIAWSYFQEQNPNANHDALLSDLRDSTSLWMGLLSHLATVDRSFFMLAKRMAAGTLIQKETPAKIYLHMAAALLIGDPPKQSKPKAARDTAIIIAVAVAHNLGWKPTEGIPDKSSPRSSCGRMCTLLSEKYQITIEYTTLEHVWKHRKRRLQAAGFSQDDTSEFLGLISPMK